MAEQTIDKLQIEVEASTYKSMQALEKLETRLDALQKAMNGIDVSKLDNMQKAINSANKSGGLKIDTSGISKAQKDVINSVGKIQQSLAGLQSYANAAMNGDSSSYTSFERRVISIQSAIDVLREKFAQLGNTNVPTETMERLQKAMERTGSELESLKAKEQQMTDSGGKPKDGITEEWTNLQNSIKETSAKYDELLAKQNELINSGKAYTDPLQPYKESLEQTSSQLNQTVQDVRDAVAALNAAQVKPDNSGLDETKEKAYAARISLKDMFDGAVNKAFEGIKKSLKGIVSALAGVKKSADGFFDKGFMKILKYGFGIRSIYVLFRRLRKAITESFGELQKSGAFYETTRENVESLKTSLLTLKYQFGAAFEPIFNAVAPALKILIDKLVDAMNAVSAFMARLTGNSTYSKVKWVNTATGEAAKNAKELNKQLQKFDELNNLTTNQGGSGSGSKDETKAVYEEASVDSALGDFGKRLADLIRAGEWGEVGKVLSDKFAEQFESIDWNAIKRKAATFGQKLADFLNNLINPRLLNDIGMTIGESINTGLTFFNEWGKGMDWENLGVSLAEGFDAFIQTGWIGNLGETLHTWIAGGLVALTTFFETADFEEVGKQIAEFIGNLDIPDLASKLLKLAKAIIFALADAIKSLWTNGDATTRIGMAIVGLIGLAKLTGLVGTIGGLLSTALGGSTITASATGATLKLTGLKKIAGLTLAVSGAILPEFSIGDNLLEDGIYDALGATAMYGGLRLLGFSPKVALTIAVGKFAWDFGTELGKSLMAALYDALGDSEMAKYYREFSWAKFFPDVIEAAQTGNLSKGAKMMFTGPAGAIAGKANELIDDDTRKQLEEFKKTYEEVIGAIRNPFGGSELNTSDLGTSALGAWKGFTDGANQADTATKSLKDTVASFIEQTRNLNSETSKFGYEAESSTNKFRFGISGIASETVDIFQNAYNKGTKTWSGLGTWAKSKSKDMGNGFVGIPKEVASKFQTAYTESTKAWNDIGTWATGVTNTTANGMNNLPTDVSKRFGDAYTQGTAKWNDLGRWATERSAITSGAFNTFPTSASKQFGDAYTQGTGKWGGLKTWADTTFSAVSTASNTNLSKIPSQFQTNFQQGTAKAEGLVGSFKTWLDRQNLVKKAGVEPDTFAFSNVQSKINNIISSLARVKSTTISISGNGFEAVGTKIKNLANQLTNLKNTSSSVSLGSSLGLKLFASGGVVGGATPAIVGEAGPEAILPLTDGTLGKLANMIVGDMAVPNSPVLANQSYSSYSNTMNASSMAEQNKLLQEQNDLLRQIASKDLTISSSEVFNATRSEANNYYNRTGNSPFLI